MAPVLANILLTALGDSLQITGTDDRMLIRQVIPAAVAAGGSVTVPAHLLAGLVRLSDDEYIELTDLNRRSVQVTCSTFSMSLRCIDASEFPSYFDLSTESNILVRAGDFVEALNQVLFATGKDEGRPVLTGVSLNFSAETITLVGSDGYRLAERKLALINPATHHEPLIVSSHALDALRALLRDDAPGATVAIRPALRQIVFVATDSLLASRVMEGMYPAYGEIVRKRSSTRVRVSVAELARKLQAAVLVATSEAGTVRLQTSRSGLELSVRGGPLGDIESMVAARVQGPPVQLTINGQYVVQVLEVVAANEVEIGLNGADEPAMIRPIHRDDFLYVVLPVHERPRKPIGSE